jgi:hypothetical protein
LELGRWNGAEAALAMMEFFDGFIEVGPIKVRPHAIGEEQFGIR